MDRNDIAELTAHLPLVALRKESVDRNEHPKPTKQAEALSLSARRAWIEMLNFCLPNLSNMVALRKESVDRNIRI